MSKLNFDLLEAAIGLLEALDGHIPHLREQVKGEWVHMDIRFEREMVEAYRKLETAVDSATTWEEKK